MSSSRTLVLTTGLSRGDNRETHEIDFTEERFDLLKCIFTVATSVGFCYTSEESQQMVGLSNRTIRGLLGELLKETPLSRVVGGQGKTLEMFNLISVSFTFTKLAVKFAYWDDGRCVASLTVRNCHRPQ